MGAQRHKPRDVNQAVLEVENATNLRDTHCGEDITPVSGGGASTLGLEVEEPLATIMADWPWESTPASTSQQALPLQASPLQSSSSQSSHEAMQRTGHEFTRPGSRRPTSARTSLVETLQTYFTSLPPGPSTPSELTSPMGRSQSDPTGAAPPPIMQSRSSGALNASTSAKPMKRRSRASRRPPTTVIEVSSGGFRDMVQRLTGIPVAAPPSQAPVRPQPQRAAPTYIRPDRPLPSASVIRPSSSAANDFTPPSTRPTFDDLRNSPRGNPSVKRELESGTSVHTPFSRAGGIVTTRAPTAPSNWWEPAPLDQINLPTASSENASVGASGPVSVSSSVGLMGLQEDIPELSMTQFDAWLSGEDQH